MGASHEQQEDAICEAFLHRSRIRNRCCGCVSDWARHGSVHQGFNYVATRDTPLSNSHLNNVLRLQIPYRRTCCAN
jgi:hypothetical protein